MQQEAELLLTGGATSSQSDTKLTPKSRVKRVQETGGIPMEKLNLKMIIAT
jgi:hypothetical protein